MRDKMKEIKYNGEDLDVNSGYTKSFSLTIDSTDYILKHDFHKPNVIAKELVAYSIKEVLSGAFPKLFIMKNSCRLLENMFRVEGFCINEESLLKSYEYVLLIQKIKRFKGNRK